MKLTPRQKAARKAARTRALNKAREKQWFEVELPLKLAVVALANKEIGRQNGVAVRFVEREGGIRLHRGDGTGRLLKILGTGLAWRVWAKGYANPIDYYAGFWEVIKP
jgi:hypothetical protein